MDMRSRSLSNYANTARVLRFSFCAKRQTTKTPLFERRGNLTRRASSERTQKIWGDDGYRIFLSHKAEVKREAGALKDKLGLFGATCFVAHEDIQPTKAWQDEIENALKSMDAFVALLTKKYHYSKWTDQEVGFAVCRGVPVIAVRFDIDPYGFIG